MQFKEKVKNKYKTITSIILITWLIGIIFHRLFANEFAEIPLSVIAETLGITLTASILLMIDFIIIALIFLYFEEYLYGNRLIKGGSYGIAIGGLWFIGMIEMVHLFNSLLINEVLMGIADGIPIILLGLLLGKYVIGDIDNKMGENRLIKNSRTIYSAESLISISVMTVFVFVGKYFSYLILDLNAPFSPQPFDEFLWTIAYSIWIGIMYSLMVIGSDKKSMNPMILFGCIFGINWLIYTLFVPVIWEIELLGAIIRVISDIFFVIIGVFALEKIINNTND